MVYRKRELNEDQQKEREEMIRLFAKRMTMRRIELGLTQVALNEKTGIAVNTISGWETGKRMPPEGNMKRLAQALRTTVDWLKGDTNYVEGDERYLQNNKDGPKLEYINIVSPETGRNVINVSDGFYATHVQWELRGKYPVMEEYLFDYSSSLKNGNLYVMKVDGNGMSPSINSNDYVMFCFGARVSDGDIAVVQYGDSLRVRRLSYYIGGNNPNTVTLEATNKEFDSIVIDFDAIKKNNIKFAILGKVIYICPHLIKPQSRWG